MSIAYFLLLCHTAAQTFLNEMNTDSRVLGVCKTASRLVADVKWLVTTGISGVLGAKPPNSPFFFHINKILGTPNLYLNRKKWKASNVHGHL